MHLHVQTMDLVDEDGLGAAGRQTGETSDSRPMPGAESAAQATIASEISMPLKTVPHNQAAWTQQNSLARVLDAAVRGNSDRQTLLAAQKKASKFATSSAGAQSRVSSQERATVSLMADMAVQVQKSEENAKHLIYRFTQDLTENLKQQYTMCAQIGARATWEMQVLKEKHDQKLQEVALSNSSLQNVTSDSKELETLRTKCKLQKIVNTNLNQQLSHIHTGLQRVAHLWHDSSEHTNTTSKKQEESRAILELLLKGLAGHEDASQHQGQARRKVSEAGEQQTNKGGHVKMTNTELLRRLPSAIHNTKLAEQVIQLVNSLYEEVQMLRAQVRKPGQGQGGAKNALKPTQPLKQPPKSAVQAALHRISGGSPNAETVSRDSARVFVTPNLTQNLTPRDSSSLAAASVLRFQAQAENAQRARDAQSREEQKKAVKKRLRE